MNWECFFFDVDGTLLDNVNHQISESTLKALRCLKQKGKKIVVCSGRSLIGVMEVEALRSIEWDGFVTLNGSVFCDAEGNEQFRHQMPKEVVKKIIDVSNQYQVVLGCLSKKERLTRQPDEYTLRAYGFFHRSVDHFEIAPLHEEDALSMVLAFGPSDWDYAPFKEIKELLVLPTRFNYADINDATINKSVGIQEACRYFQVDIQQTMAFGDGINDIEMIEAVGMGVAMGQGHPQVKEKADYITDAVDQDGIWNALVHFGVL